ncbi:MAG: hypothetical protein FD180_918 [Planctomycetota bacterium]|nr:MAG: hypothetical protein FD180_918 [Planctomycetota bacterium]
MTNSHAHPPGGDSRKSSSGSQRLRPAASPPRQIPFASLAADYVRFRCRCNRVLQTVEGMEGHEVRCPACHTVAEVPGARHEEAIPELAPMPAKHESKIPELAPMEEAVAEVEPIEGDQEVEPISADEGELPELKPMTDGEGPATPQ